MNSYPQCKDLPIPPMRNVAVASEQTDSLPTTLLRAQNVNRPITACASPNSKDIVEFQERPVSAHTNDEKPDLQQNMVNDWSKLFFGGKKVRSRRKHEIITTVSSMGNLIEPKSRPSTAKPSMQNTPRARPYSAHYNKRPKSARSIREVPHIYSKVNKIKPKVKINTKGICNILSQISKCEGDNLKSLIMIKGSKMINEKDIAMIKNVQNTREKRKPALPIFNAQKANNTEKSTKITPNQLTKIKNYAELLVTNTKFANELPYEPIDPIKEEEKDLPNQLENNLEIGAHLCKKTVHQRPQSARTYSASRPINSDILIRFNNAALDALQINKHTMQNLQTEKRKNEEIMHTKKQQISHKRAWSARNHKVEMHQKTYTSSSKDRDYDQLQLMFTEKEPKEIPIFNEFQATLPSTAHKYPILHSLDCNSKIFTRIHIRARPA